MAKAPGRLAVLSKAGTPIAGIKALSIEFTSEPIEVTDRNSNGVVEYLDDNKTTQCKLSVSGITDTNVLRAIFTGPTASRMVTDLTFTYASAGALADVISGDFFMTSYKEENPDDDACTFSAEFVSSGPYLLS